MSRLADIPANYFRVDLRIFDSKKPTSSPAGPRIWVNQMPIAEYNRQIAAKTGKQGGAGSFFLKPDTDAWIWIEAEGYQAYKGQVPTTFNAMPRTVDCPLNVTPPPTKGTCCVTVLPGLLSGAGVKLTDASGKSFSGTTAGGKASFENLPFGAYTIAASFPPQYEDGAGSVDFKSDGQAAEVTLALKAAPSEIPSSPDVELPTPQEDMVANSTFRILEALPPNIDRDVSEDVYGNSAWEAYFTGAQVRAYIGNLFLDELQSIQYALQTNVVPVYGYASRYADAWADGKSLVQGQLVVNYVSEGYLYAVLDEYRKRMRQTAEDDATTRDTQDLSRYLEARRAGLASANKFANSLDELLRNPDAVRRAAQQANWEPVYTNACYQPVTFDLALEIGAGEHRTVRRLEKCRLVSNEQIIGPDGNVIGDAYGFIARRLR